MNSDAEIKKLNYDIQDLLVERAELRRLEKQWSGYDQHEDRKDEIEQELAVLRQQLREAQASAVAGAIGKG